MKTRIYWYGVTSVVGILLFGASWYCIHKYSLQQGKVSVAIIKTDEQAQNAAVEFLNRAQVDLNHHDLSNATIKTDQLKGYKVWIVEWKARPEFTTDRNLTVLVYETGYFYYHQMINATEGTEISGDSSTVHRARISVEK